MVEVTNRCPACGAATRPKAIFCHHCGRPLALEPTVVVAPPVNGENLDLPANDADLKADVAALSLPAPNKPQITATEEPLDPNSPANDAISEFQESQSAVAAPDSLIETILVQPGAASDEKAVATSTKRKSKRYINQTEYVWEAGEAPAWRVFWFAVIVLILVGILVWLSNSLR